MSYERLTVYVNLPGRDYSIEIGIALLDILGNLVANCCAAHRATLITDSNVGPLYAGRVVRSLTAAGYETEVLTVPAGDATKSLTQAGRLYDELARTRHGRNDPLLALGGGMVGDLTGFVAATWLRGVPFVQCPTTVEADVDASVGGKTALNHPTGKNLIGAFYQPVLVCIDTNCLATLEPRDFHAGLAESIKHAIIRDPAFLSWHEEHATEILAREPGVLRELIRRNCENKAAVVMADERELDDLGIGRAALNFGHTIGHAIEAQSHFELRHGEAVALGMVAALDLAVRHCGFPEEQRRRVEHLLEVMGLPVRAPREMDIADIIDRLNTDKKVRDAKVRFVLPSRLGVVQWVDHLTVADIESSLARLAGA